MALLLDGTLSTIEDLQRYESAILDVAATENIDLNVKLDLAREEIEIELTAAISQMTGGQRYSTAPDLRQIVATPPMKQWHRLYALSLIYRDAYNSQLNDRYAGKWRDYAELAKAAAARLYQIGLGYASDPVSKSPQPDLSQLPGTSAAATYFVRVSFTNAAGAEGEPSPLATLETTDGSLLLVRPQITGQNVRGWNVYAGTTPAVTLQNDLPLPVDSGWIPPSGVIREGAAPGEGQTPDGYLTFSRTFRRG